MSRETPFFLDNFRHEKKKNLKITQFQKGSLSDVIVTSFSILQNANRAKIKKMPVHRFAYGHDIRCPN